MSPTLSKKLLAAFVFLLAVIFLIGDDDDPGLIAETAQTADGAGGYDDTSDDFAGPAGSPPGAQDMDSEPDYDNYDNYDDEGSIEASPMSDDELIDDTEGFEPVPMHNATPTDGLPPVPQEEL